MPYGFTYNHKCSPADDNVSHETSCEALDSLQGTLQKIKVWAQTIYKKNKSMKIISNTAIFSNFLISVV